VTKALAQPALDGSGVGAVSQIHLDQAFRAEPSRAETGTHARLPQ